MGQVQSINKLLFLKREEARRNGVFLLIDGLVVGIVMRFTAPFYVFSNGCIHGVEMLGIDRVYTLPHEWSRRAVSSVQTSPFCVSAVVKSRIGLRAVLGAHFVIESDIVVDSA